MAFEEIKNKFNLKLKGKLSNWIAYATGEVILITLGILLAFYIQKINEKNTERENEIQTKTQLVNDFQSDISRLKTQIDFMENHLKTISLILSLINEDKNEKSDSVLLLLTNNHIGFYRFVPTNVDFNALISKYNLNIIKDKTIIEKISLIYYAYSNFEINSYIEVVKS